MTEMKVIFPKEISAESLRRLRREHLHNSRMRRLNGGYENRFENRVIELFSEDLNIA